MISVILADEVVAAEVDVCGRRKLREAKKEARGSLKSGRRGRAKPNPSRTSALECLRQ